MRNYVCEEIKKRVIQSEERKDKYEIVGVEIKNKRASMAMTLEALSDEVCSLSYLCKIERNKIEPNVKFLQEICGRLELTEDKVDVLLNLRDVLRDCVTAFLENDYELIENAFKQGEGFENYRYSIISMIYYISQKRLYDANRIYLNLLPIISNMRDFDFTIFAVFSAYLEYYNFHFNNALLDLDDLDKFNLSKELKLLKDICIFNSAYALNKVETPILYDRLRMEIINSGHLNLLDNINYVIGLYYIKNDASLLIDEVINSFTNKKYKISLKFLDDYKNRKLSNLYKYKVKDLLEFPRLIKLYLENKDKFIDEVLMIEGDYYDINIDILYLEFLAHVGDDDFDEYIFKTLIPRINSLNDNYMKHFIINNIALRPFSAYKNRSLTKAYQLLYSDISLEE